LNQKYYRKGRTCTENHRESQRDTEKNTEHMEINDITSKIIGCAIEVHKSLGPGLLESAYEECLAYELIKAGISIKRQLPTPIVYKEVKLECGYRIDILAEDSVLIELKVVDEFNPVHEAQILTYLKFSNKSVGLLINFNVTVLKNGIRRFRL
jgi:GxxExxY protein